MTSLSKTPVRSAGFAILLMLSPPLLNAEEMSPTELLSRIRSGRDELTPQVQEIMRGATLETTYRPALKAKFSDAQKKDLESYRSWMKAEGENLVEKLLSSHPIPPEKCDLLHILQASAMFKAWGNGGPERSKAGEPAGQYASKVVSEGETAMKKGFTAGTLSDADIAALRAYLVYSAMRLTSVKIVPHDFGIGAETLKPGQDAHPMKIPVLETILASPKYSDELVQDDCAFLKPAGVAKLLEIISFYENGAEKNRQDPAEGYFNLHEKKEAKPAVFVFGYAPDVFLKVCMPIYDVLSKSYRGKADFHYVNTNYHDTYATGPVFAGAEAGNDNIRLTHPQSIEQRARMAKALYITYPSASVNCLLDNMGQTVRNAYHVDGGSAQFYIIDADGKIAYASPSSWFGWTGGNYTDTVLWANEIELQLRKILDNGGRRDKSLESLPPKSTRFGAERPAKRKAFVGKKAQNYAYGAGRFIWLTGRIEACDASSVSVSPDLGPENEMKGLQAVKASNGALKLGKDASDNLSALEKWLAMAQQRKPAKFAVADDVEIFINGQEAEPQDLQKGDFAGIWLDFRKHSPEDQNTKPIQIRVAR